MEGDKDHINPLLGATRFLDVWNSEESGTPPKVRVCIDLKKRVNACLADWKFQYETIESYLNDLRPSDKLFSFDIESMCPMLPLHQDFSDYTSFQDPISGKIMKHTRVPFGLSTAPAFICVCGWCRDKSNHFEENRKRVLHVP